MLTPQNETHTEPQIHKIYSIYCLDFFNKYSLFALYDVYKMCIYVHACMLVFEPRNTISTVMSIVFGDHASMRASDQVSILHSSNPFSVYHLRLSALL